MKTGLNRERLVSVETEKHLHKRLVRFLRTMQKTEAMGKFIFTHIKNDVGRRGGKFFFDLEPLGVLPGTPDFLFLLPSGRSAFLEIKREKGRLSESQKSFKKEAGDLDHQVFVAFGWNQILDAVTSILQGKSKTEQNEQLTERSSMKNTRTKTPRAV